MAFSHGFAYLHIFSDKISTPPLRRSLDKKCGRLLEESATSFFCLFEDGKFSYCLCSANLEKSTEGDGIFLLF